MMKADKPPGTRTMSLRSLIDRYCEAWSSPDLTERARLLESVWAAGATYTDPNVKELDKGELLAHIAKIQSTRPGAKVLRTTEVDEHHGVLRFGFQVLGQDGNILRQGIDFAFLDASRTRLQKVVGFFGELVPVSKGT
jgi:hypothetical protein